PAGDETRDLDAASRRGEHHRIGEKIDDDLPDLAFIGSDHSDLGPDRQVQRYPVSVSSLTVHGQPAVQGLGNRYVPQLQLHPPRLDLREIQDVVDERKEVLARLEDVTDVPDLRLVQLAEHLLLE